MEVFQMQAVVAIVETGSFSKAAEALFASPQTIKNQMDALELELGVRLFTRTQKGAVPTAGVCRPHLPRLIFSTPTE